MNQSAENLFLCGHVQRIEVGTGTGASSTIWVRADCLPEMKKDRIYKVILCLNDQVFDIVEAQCGCPAGKGPTASCKHIGALCYALRNFCDHGRVPKFLTCTQRLQEWNQPRKKKVDPVPVVDIKDRKQSIKGVRKSSGSRTPTKYDPRPPNLRFQDFEAVEQLRVDLLSSGRSYALTTLLVPPVEKISHDHCYVSTNVKQHTTSIRLNDSTSTCVCPHSTEDFMIMRCC